MSSGNFQSGDAALTQNHPRVVSLISNTDEVYQSNGGGLRVFAPVISEKGEEVAKLITSAKELNDKYGMANAKKYGQAAYNLQKWLQAGGDAIVLRVMPDNAGFAHAFVNVQTKVNTKTVKKHNVNELVTDFPNVTLKTTISTTGNNSESELLKLELFKDRSLDITIDGFQDNLLFSVEPKGRGEYYNKLGFRLTPNSQMDTILNSRIYNFEVVEFRNNDLIDIKEGPFLISFDKDALSPTNEESLFIEDVVNKYSKYFKIEVNEEAFINIGKIINPSVNPYILDPFFGKTRLMINGEVEKNYNELTNGLEDVHINMQKYNISGLPVYDQFNNIVLNYINADDVIEKSIVSINNTFKDEQKKSFETTLENMKLAGELVKNGSYCSTIISEDESAGLLFDLEEMLTSLTGSTPKIAIPSIKAIRKIEDLYKAIGITSEDLAIESLIKRNEILISSFNSITIKKDSYINKLSDIGITFTNDISLAGTSLDKKTAIIARTLTDLAEVVEYIRFVNNSAILDIQPETNGFMEINSILTQYNTCLTNYEIITDMFESDANIKNAIGILVGGSGLTQLINDSKTIILNLTNTIGEKITTSIIGDLVGASGLNSILAKLKLIKASKFEVVTDGSTPEQKQSLLNNIRSNINLYMTEYKIDAFTTSLTNYSNSLRLFGGHDGDLDINNPNRSSVIKSLLIKAFNGLIDENIVNKQILPFNFVLDANYPIEVKNAIVNLADNVRKDFMFMADCQLQSDAESVLQYRKSQFPISSNLVAIYGQDIIVYDEFTGKDQRFTMPYLLASKIPTLNSTVGLQYALAGSKRGVIDGFKSINFIPNASYQELLYNNRVNYAISDDKRTKLNSQLTSDFKKTPLSNINAVITMLNIKRDAEGISENYQFEFSDGETQRALQQELNTNLNKYVTNRACDFVDASVFASEYDLSQNILRVSIKIKFKDIIETVVITLDVVR